jgi:hypothetical protein
MPRNGNSGDIAELCTSNLETSPNRIGGESAFPLSPAEPLFFDGGEYPAVAPN